MIRSTLLALAALLTVTACSTTQSNATAVEQTADGPDRGALTLATPEEDLSVAYLAGGCFWCLEASFERIEGVQSVISGYSGGHTENPTYEESNTGNTGHAEAIAVYYDPAVISYRRLLDVFFVAHDPTTLNRQGPDVGTQYRSGIFYETPEQLATVKTVVDSVNQVGLYSNPIVTEIKPFDAFYDAEDYHQGYYELHPESGYIQNVSRPKVEKVEKVFADLLKEPYRKA